MPIERTNEKFLVRLLHGLTDKQMFFLVWAGIAGSFVWMFVNYYRRQTRSNFRRPEDGPGRKIAVDLRRLESSKGSDKTLSTTGAGREIARKD